MNCMQCGERLFLTHDDSAGDNEHEPRNNDIGRLEAALQAEHDLRCESDTKNKALRVALTVARDWITSESGDNRDVLEVIEGSLEAK